MSCPQCKIQYHVFAFFACVCFFRLKEQMAIDSNSPKESIRWEKKQRGKLLPEVALELSGRQMASSAFPKSVIEDAELRQLKS